MLPRSRLFLLSLLFGLAANAVAQKAEQNTSGTCIRPPVGSPNGSCGALKIFHITQSQHVGDQWSDCEEMSGKHGTAGYGVAAFFAEEARPYWNAEIAAYLSMLESSRSPKEYQRILVQQEAWSNQRPAQERRAMKNTGGEGGTLAMYIGEGQVTQIARHRALILGCMVESKHSERSSVTSTKPSQETPPK